MEMVIDQCMRFSQRHFLSRRLPLSNPISRYCSSSLLAFQALAVGLQVLQGLITLFYEPNFEDPLNMEAGAQGAVRTRQHQQLFDTICVVHRGT